MTLLHVTEELLAVLNRRGHYVGHIGSLWACFIEGTKIPYVCAPSLRLHLAPLHLGGQNVQGAP